MDGLLPTSRQIDHLALFKEINEFVSFHELLEPLSPYSSDSDSCLSPEDNSTNLSLFDSTHTRVKNRYKHNTDSNTLKLRDPSGDKLFQMLAKGTTTRKKQRDSFMSNSCSRVSIVNEDSTTRERKNSGRGGARMRKNQHQEQQLVPSPSNDYPLYPCATSSLQQQQQNAVQRSALVKFKSLSISDRGSYFNTLDKGLSKYPNYFDYVDNIKKPFKQIEDLPCGPSSGSNHNSLSDVDTQFNCSIGPPSPDLSPDILSALNSCLFSSN